MFCKRVTSRNLEQIGQLKYLKVPPFTLFMTKIDKPQGMFCSNSSNSNISNRITSVSMNTKYVWNSKSTCTTSSLLKPNVIHDDFTSLTQDKQNHFKQSTLHNMDIFEEKEPSIQNNVMVIDISDDESQKGKEDKVNNSDEISIIYDSKNYSEEQSTKYNEELQECHKMVVGGISRIDRQYRNIWHGTLTWNIGKIKISTNCIVKSENTNANLISIAEDWCRNQCLQLLSKCNLESYVAAIEKGTCVVLVMEKTSETKQLWDLLADEHTGFISISSSSLENQPIEIILVGSCLTDSKSIVKNNQLIFKGLMISPGKLLTKRITQPMTNTNAWQGTLVWKKKLSTCSLALILQVSCSVNTGSSLLEVKPSSWSSTLTMQMFPHSILNFLNENSIRGVIIDIELLAGEDLEILHYSLSCGLAGCIHVSHEHTSNDPLRVIILTFNKERNKYIGFMPSDQDLFCSELKHFIVKYQQKFNGE
ncbi:unnamed protein product [Meganyctiphanes norvegica]|uniref:Mediator complex subunit Med25 PTOV domain-containing protein n=1 Tax=Meganyctiphanes norvegica TaxID=48144 RepID=A0AAV2R5Z2_MEGNR